VLERLRIQNFRLLRDVEIVFEQGAPTVFIGPNGSGKSTVLEALDFLSRCASEGLQAAAAAHGGVQSILTIGAKGPIVFEMSWGFVKKSENNKAHTLHWGVSLQPETSGVVTVVREELIDAASTPPQHLITTNDRGVRSVLAENANKAKPSTAKSSTKLTFEELVDPDRFHSLTSLNVLLTSINVIGAISTSPTWARADQSAGSPRDSLVIGPQMFLNRQGLGLANVLFGLFNNHREAWEDLERAFRAEFPFVRRIVFPPDVGGSRIAFAFEDERFAGRKLFASEMSDGMIAYLCLLSSVLNPEQVGILALDEPDANLHPSALRRFMALAHRQHDKRNLAIVTHSNAVLDELRDPARSIRVVESTKTGARIRKLDDQALAAWRKDYSVSDMRRTGLLDPTNASYGTDE
jgi:predicted ATPase